MIKVGGPSRSAQHEDHDPMSTQTIQTTIDEAFERRDKINPKTAERDLLRLTDPLSHGGGPRAVIYSKADSSYFVGSIRCSYGVPGHMT